MTPILLLSSCNQHDKMQLFAKFKQNLQRGFRAALNFEMIGQYFGINLYRVVIIKSWKVLETVSSHLYRTDEFSMYLFTDLESITISAL